VTIGTVDGTTGSISIKFRGTESDSELLLFKTGLIAGTNLSITFTFPTIGTLVNVYLETNSVDNWTFNYVSIQFNNTIVMTFEESRTLSFYSFNLVERFPSFFLSFFFFKI